MQLKEKIKIHLDQIKQIRGIENAVLTQRDGNPIQSTGVWFSKDEIFNVCAATSAIYNVGIHLYPENLKYMLIEGKKAKILIAPLNNPLHRSLNKILEKQGIIDDNQEFYIAITAQPNVNLGGIFLQTNECLRKIKTTLITSGESFKPPLIEFNKKKLDDIMENFKVKEFREEDLRISSYSLSFSEDVSFKLKKILEDLSNAIRSIEYALITVDGGFIASKLVKSNFIGAYELDNISAMSYSLFQTANRCAWLLKKMNAENLLIDGTNTFQFIKNMGKALFTVEISKSNQKLGLLRLFLPQFTSKIDLLIKSAMSFQKEKKFDVHKLFGELVIK